MIGPQSQFLVIFFPSQQLEDEFSHTVIHKGMLPPKAAGKNEKRFKLYLTLTFKVIHISFVTTASLFLWALSETLQISTKGNVQCKPIILKKMRWLIKTG